MSSRIYVVTTRASGVEQFVRANNLNAAVRAVATESFACKAATTEQMFQAYKLGIEVLDAVKDEETPSE